LHSRKPAASVDVAGFIFSVFFCNLVAMPNPMSLIDDFIKNEKSRMTWFEKLFSDRKLSTIIEHYKTK